jgi:hypothetical protein
VRHAAARHGGHPALECPGAGASGWLNKDGSFGDGYWRYQLNSLPYTVSTETMAAFYAEWSALADAAPGSETGAAAAAVAQGAVAWLFDQTAEDGSIPYLLNGTVDGATVYVERHAPSPAADYYYCCCAAAT